MQQSVDKTIEFETKEEKLKLEISRLEKTVTELKASKTQTSEQQQEKDNFIRSLREEIEQLRVAKESSERQYKDKLETLVQELLASKKTMTPRT